MRRIWTPFIILISVGAILGFFQNCTPAVPFGNTDYFQSLVNSPVFPYEVGVDQVAYMSCSEQDQIVNDGTFFTFRVGAFDSQGLRITQEYRDSIVKVSDEDVPYALQQNQASSATKLQIAIRTMDNLQLMYVNQDNGADGIDGEDFNNFFPSMGDGPLNERLWSMDPAEYMRYNPQAQFVSDYRFEGELQFMKSQIMENDLRTFLSNRGVITVTFAEQGEIKPVGPGSLINLQELADSGQSGNVSIPAGDEPLGVTGASANGNFQTASNDLTADVFGAAIQPRFKQPLFQGTQSPGPDMPPRILSTINDVTIDSRLSGQSLNPWICPDSMNFMIVLAQDATYQDLTDPLNPVLVTRCSMNPDPINPSPELQIIRQSLYAEDYYVDMARKCIVPKPDHTVEGSCYGKDTNTQMTHIINYDTFNTTGCGFGNIGGLCPHYASICVRQ